MADADAEGKTLATESDATLATDDGNGGTPSENQDSQSTVATGSDSTQDWRKSLPDDIQKRVEKFKSADTLANSYVELENKLADGLKAPGEGASQEELDKWHGMIGRPDTSGGYELKEVILPKNIGTASDPKAFSEMAHRAGLSQAQAQAMWNEAADTAMQASGELRRRKEAAESEAISTLHKEWGTEYDSRMGRFRQAVQTFGDEDFTRLLNKGPGNDPALFRFVDKIAKELSDDTLETGQPSLRAQADSNRKYPNSPEMYGAERQRAG